MMKLILVHENNSEIAGALHTIIEHHLKCPVLRPLSINHPAVDIVMHLVGGPEQFQTREEFEKYPYSPRPELNCGEAISSMKLALSDLISTEDWLSFSVREAMQADAQSHCRMLFITTSVAVEQYLTFFEKHFNIFHIYNGYENAEKVDPTKAGVFIPDESEVPYAFGQLVGWLYS